MYSPEVIFVLWRAVGSSQTRAILVMFELIGWEQPRSVMMGLGPPQKVLVPSSVLPAFLGLAELRWKTENLCYENHKDGCIAAIGNRIEILSTA